MSQLMKDLCLTCCLYYLIYTPVLPPLDLYTKVPLLLNTQGQPFIVHVLLLLTSPNASLHTYQNYLPSTIALPNFLTDQYLTAAYNYPPCYQIHDQSLCDLQVSEQS